MEKSRLGVALFCEYHQITSTFKDFGIDLTDNAMFFLIFFVKIAYI